MKATIARLIAHADRPGFLAACGGLAFLGTLGAAYPVTAIVAPASLVVPRRWLAIACACALGSALAATALVMMAHELGWSLVGDHFPELVRHRGWVKIVGWAAEHGALLFFVVAVSPLPQTPFLVVFALARQDYAAVFVAVLAGKLLKYAFVAGLAAQVARASAASAELPDHGRARIAG